ncbi:MAG: hypothetical protein ACR2IK_21810 [Chloroflexota bacterium]
MIASTRAMQPFRVVRIAVVGAALALLPLTGVAHAQTSTPLTPAQARAAANLANDLAQCKLAAAGVKTSGKPGISGELPAGVAMPACAPGAAATTPSPMPASTMTTGTCAAATRSLTKPELSLVNDYEIAIAKAASNFTAPPVMSPDVSALIGCL